LGTDAGNPSEEITCAEAIEALSNRPGTAAVATVNNFTSFCLFIIPPYLVGVAVRRRGVCLRLYAATLATQFDIHAR
jgi:hypothetical protein